MISQRKFLTGAHWDDTIGTQRALKNGAKRIAGPKVGAESLTLYGQQGSGPTTAVFSIIYFRQGPVDDIAGVGGLRGKVALAQAMHDARIVAAREPKR